VLAEGGTAAPLTGVRVASDLAQTGSHRWPYFLPDGEHFLYLDAKTASCSVDNEIHFASLDGKTNTVVLKTCSSVAYAAGHLLYWRDGNLVAQHFDAKNGKLSGTAQVIADHISFDTLFSRAMFTASDAGSIAYVEGNEAVTSQLVWHDREGKMLGTLGTSEPYDMVAISPDGQRVAYDTADGLWVQDSRGTKVRLRSGMAFAPSWSADGKRVYFSASGGNGKYDIRSVAADGSGGDQMLLEGKDIPGQLGAPLINTSADGKYLTFVTSSSTTKLDNYALPLDGHSKFQPVLASPANEYMPSISPDGKWLAYQGDQSGRYDIYVTRFPEGGAQFQVSTGGGEKPVWRRDGKELYYRAPDMKLTAVEVMSKDGTLQFGTPKPLFEMPLRNLNSRSYDVAPNGHFLSNTSLSTPTHNIELLLNWPGGLKK
jgi:hypothetical protein